MSYPDLSPEQVNRLAVAWVEDRRNDLGMDTDDFHIIPSDGETIIRITGDPVLVQALREIGIEAMGDKKLYNMIMAISDAVLGEKWEERCCLAVAFNSRAATQEDGRGGVWSITPRRYDYTSITP